MNKIRDINPDDFFNCNSSEEKIKFLLRYAILAPSTHNSQPWMFKIKTHSCEIYYDSNLKIPNADPESRDLFISIGCAIENFIIAAKYFNVFKSVTYILRDWNNLVAEINFRNFNLDDIQPNSNLLSLIQILPKRINARGLFTDKTVSPLVINNIIMDVTSEKEYEIDTYNIDFLEDTEKIRELANLTGEGIKIAYKSGSFRKEMSGWLRNSFTFKKDGLPGYSLKMPAFFSLFFPTLVRYVNVGNKLAKLNKISIQSAPLACIISAEEREKHLTWVKIGRIAERLMLEFNKAGYNTSIFIASIEMGKIYKKVQQILNIRNRPQFIFMIGNIGSLHKYTPRHSVESKIVN